MCEIDVTEYLEQAEHGTISASAAELGSNAGPITWANACAEAATSPLLTNAGDLAAARDWLGEFGAWEDAELAAMPDHEIRALVLQFVSGDIREAESLAPGDGIGSVDWDAYRALQEAGQCSGYLYLGDDGRAYFGLH